MRIFEILKTILNYYINVIKFLIGTNKIDRIRELVIFQTLVQMNILLNDTRRIGQPPKSQLTKKSTSQKVNLSIK
jgi:hypothetical protein